MSTNFAVSFSSLYLPLYSTSCILQALVKKAPSDHNQTLHTCEPLRIRFASMSNTSLPLANGKSCYLVVIGFYHAISSQLSYKPSLLWIQPRMMEMSIFFPKAKALKSLNFTSIHAASWSEDDKVRIWQSLNCFIRHC